MEGKVFVVYLGRKGSGLNLVASLLDEFHLNGISIVAIFLNSNNNSSRNMIDKNIKIIHFNKFLLASFLQSFHFGFFFLKYLKTYPDPIIIFPMSSPLDLALALILKIRNIKTFRFIHETKSHLGERWPDAISNRILIKCSTHLVTLSTFEQNQLLKIYGRESLRIKHPIFPPPKDFAPHLILEEKIVLFIGRIKRYKGISNLLEAWEIFSDSDYILRVCGEGKMPQIKNSISLQIENRWLSDWELQKEISRSEIIVFPYLEASQSGLIPIAISKRKKIVITPVGGLSEQVGSYKNAFIADGTSPQSLQAALEKAMNCKKVVPDEISETLEDSNSFEPLVQYLKSI